MSYAIAAAAVFAFFVIWCYTVKRELDELKRSVDTSAIQVELVRNMMIDPKNESGLEQVNNMLGLSLKIYCEAAKKYNTTLHKLFYRPPSLILGFKTVSENI